MIKNDFIAVLSLALFVPTFSWASSEYLPWAPESEFLNFAEGEPDINFCAEWNPEFVFRGHRCCAKAMSRKKRGHWCSPARVKSNYCSEMTEGQREYIEQVQSGKITDVLALIDSELGLRGEQSFCTVNNGFLAWGRRLLPTPQNFIRMRSPDRCVDFGTDRMIGLLEWLGRQVGKRYTGSTYSGVHLLVGDISAPRGGCLAGRSGRRGHASHTSGQDVDIGFLSAKEGGRSPASFSRDFDATPNWFLVKQMFKNPYACVKVIFLDRKMIAKLSRAAAGDPEWLELRRFIRHVKGHKNHYHVRIGNFAGPPGCVPGADPAGEVDPDEEGEELDAAPDSGDDAAEELLDLLRSAQGIEE